MASARPWGRALGATLLAGDALFFQAVSDEGVTVDAGAIRSRVGP